MLSKELVKKIEETFKIPGLSAAFEADGETDVELPDGVHVLTDEDLTRVKNTEYANGKTKGIEMEIKQFKEEQGLEFTGKNLKALGDAISKKAVEEAKIAPDKKVEQLTKDLDTIRAEYDTLKSTVEQKEAAVLRATADKELYRAIPTLGDNAPDVSIVVDLMRSRGFDFKVEDGQAVAYKDGNPIKDNLAKIVPLKDVIIGFAKENRLIAEQTTPPAGRGNGDSAAPVYTKLSELKKDFEAQGKSALGAEFNAKAMELKRANADFDMSA